MTLVAAVQAAPAALLAEEGSATVAGTSDLVLTVGAALTAAVVALGVRAVRRDSRVSTVVLVGLVAGALTLAGGWKVRGVVRDVRSDQAEAITRVLEVRRGVLPAGPAHSADVWAVGDGADGRPASRAVVALMAATAPDAVLQLGDVYGSYAAYTDRTYGALADRVLATPGNHDWHTPSRIAQYLSYWRGHMQGRALYYEYDAAGWQILSLSSEIPQNPGSTQLRWLSQRLATPGDCRIAFFHRPRYSAGRHGDQTDLDHLWKAMRGHVALVLNGHDHDMQRLTPIDGITEMVVGSGGHGHYTVHDDPRVAFGDDTHDGALHLRLTPGSARYSFTAVDGTVLDSGRIGCRVGSG